MRVLTGCEGMEGMSQGEQGAAKLLDEGIGRVEHTEIECVTNYEEVWDEIDYMNCGGVNLSITEENEAFSWDVEGIYLGGGEQESESNGQEKEVGSIRKVGGEDSRQGDTSLKDGNKMTKSHPVATTLESEITKLYERGDLDRIGREEVCLTNYKAAIKELEEMETEGVEEDYEEVETEGV